MHDAGIEVVTLTGEDIAMVGDGVYEAPAGV